MMLKKIFLTLLIVILPTGCIRFSLEKFNEVNLEGKDFLKVLAREYHDFAESEASKYDWIDSEHFARKGLKAAQGISIDPEMPSEWNIPETILPTLQEARRELLDAVDSTTIKLSPEASAKAYFLFDCWVEEQEENWQTEHIESCRNGFFDMLNYLSIAKKNVPVSTKPIKVEKVVEVKKVKQQPKKKISSTSYVILFDFNSTKISNKGLGTVKNIVTELNGFDYNIILNGYTDRAGSENYNMKLSLKRAETVQKELTKRGIKNITFFGFGESDTKEKTPDGVRNPLNRRVEIFIN